MHSRALLALSILPFSPAADVRAPTNEGPRSPAPAVSPSAVPAATFRFGDFDADGRADVYVVNPSGADLLLHNQGASRFEDVTMMHGLAGVFGTRAALWEDFDGDGALDLYVSSAGGRSRLFQNGGFGMFVDVTSDSGLAHQEGTELAAEWLDFDGDLRRDLHLVTEHGDLLFRNVGSGRFERVALPLVGARLPQPLALPSPSGVLSPSTAGLDAAGAPPLGSTTHSASASIPGGAPTRELPPCAEHLADFASSGCLDASSTPVLGLLYPLSTDLNVSPEGRVGIGTTTPARKLDVRGDVQTSGTVISTAPRGTAPLQVSSATKVANLNADLLDGFDASALRSKWLSNPLGIHVNGGNVGIGTSTPTAPLEFGLGDKTLQIINDGNLVPGINLGGTGGNVGILRLRNSLEIWPNDARTALGRLDVRYFDGSARCTLSGTGEASFNSEELTPLRALGTHTEGTMFLLHNMSAGGHEWALISTGATNPAGPGKLLFRDHSAQTFPLTIQPNGNVGIGTLNPTDPLDVAGGVNIDYTDTNTGGIAGSLRFGGASSGEGILSKRDPGGNQHGLDFFAGTAVRMSITSAGNVGIGTGAPADKLSVAGNFSATGVKNFVQPHPTDPSKEIRFVCLEGNESGTYFRGSGHVVDGRALIVVPEEFRLVTELEGLTVQLTAVGGPTRIWVESQDLDRIVVGSDRDLKFHYLVNGVRRGYAGHQSIVENTGYVPAVRGEPFGLQYPEALREVLVHNGILNSDYTPNVETAARMGWTLQDASELAIAGNEAPSAGAEYLDSLTAGGVGQR